LKWKTSGQKKCAACASLRLVILRSLLESQGASSIFRVGIEACKKTHTHTCIRSQNKSKPPTPTKIKMKNNLNNTE
jgi:hypothetical protein